MNLTINPEYETLLPKLTAEKYSSLKNSIKEEGLWHPITVNSQGIILDGHNRYHICVELGVDPTSPTPEIKDFSDPLLEKKFVIESNLDRRHLNDFQMVELSIHLLPIEEELAKRRQIELGRTHGQAPLGSNEPEGRARDIVALKAGVSPTTFERARAVLELGSEILKQNCRDGEESISKAYGQIRGKRQVVAAKKAATKLLTENDVESEAKMPETPDELEEASQRLKAEAKRKRVEAEALKTPEQKAKEAEMKVAEKAAEDAEKKRRAEERIIKKAAREAEKERKTEEARKKAKEEKRKAEEERKRKEDELRKRLEAEAKKREKALRKKLEKKADAETRQKLLEDAKFRREAAKKEKQIREIKEVEEQEELEAKIRQVKEQASGDLSRTCRVFEADIRSCDAIKAESVDVVLTDPPYGKEHLALYEDLALFARRVLKDGGSLVVMTGQSYLPEIIATLSKHFTYNWTIAYLTPGGQSAQLWERKVNTFWKPVLWFVKGKYEGDWTGDVAKSNENDNDKRFSQWGQSESGMRSLVEKLSQPNQLIVDPFMGAGTTGVAALKLGRRFTGFDVDSKMVKISIVRLMEAVKG